MFGVSVAVSGFDQLERKLRALDISKQDKAVKAAGRFAMKPVLDDAKANVPVRSGLLRDSLRITSRTAKSRDYPFEIGITVRNDISFEDPEAAAIVSTMVGRRGVKLRGSKGKARIRASGRRIRVQTGVGWRWHFIETGAPARGIAARPFLRPALDRNKDIVIARFREKLTKIIESQARK